MQNEIIQLRRNEEKRPQQQYRNLEIPTYGFIDRHERNHNINDPFPRPRAPNVQNPNVVVQQEDIDESSK